MKIIKVTCVDKEAEKFIIETQEQYNMVQSMESMRREIAIDDLIDVVAKAYDFSYEEVMDMSLITFYKLYRVAIKNKIMLNKRADFKRIRKMKYYVGVEK